MIVESVRREYVDYVYTDRKRDPPLEISVVPQGVLYGILSRCCSEMRRDNTAIIFRLISGSSAVIISRDFQKRVPCQGAICMNFCALSPRDLNTYFSSLRLTR